jgi:hypothetical protein
MGVLTNIACADQLSVQPATLLVTFRWLIATKYIQRRSMETHMGLSARESTRFH